MSKIKFSFSLLLTFILVGMFSVVAFAAAPAKPVVYATYAESTVLRVSNFIDATNAAKYLITLDSRETEEVLPTQILTDERGKKYFDLEGVDSSQAHTVKVVVVNSSNEQSPEGTYTMKASQGPSLSGLNANSTGVVDKNKAHKDATGVHDQKIHGSYQNNTNSCASCHQTHTGSDTMLLFKNGTGATCEACHDGTLGAFDIHSQSNAGIFDGQDQATGKSMHNVNTVAISAAPGGDQDGTGNWESEFTCASCHNPHGSESDRLLVTDPMGWGSVERTASNPLGTKYTGINIVTTVPTTKISDTADYILVKTTVDTTKAPFKDNTKFNGVSNSSPILLTYKWDIKGAKYNVDYSLWLRNKLSVTGATIGTDLTVNYKDGFAYGTGAANVTAATVAFGISVDMYKTTTTIGSLNVTTVDNRAYFDANYTGKYIADSGNQMSKFCSACHNDYLSASHGQVTGVHTTAFRHITTGDSYTCVRCHFAHGTAPTIMKDSLDRGVNELTATGGKFDGNVSGATEYLKDQNPTSALKRYVGMAACFGCHDTSIGSDEETFRNSSSGQTGAQ